MVNFALAEKMDQLTKAIREKQEKLLKLCLEISHLELQGEETNVVVMNPFLVKNYDDGDDTPSEEVAVALDMEVEDTRDNPFADGPLRLGEGQTDTVCKETVDWAVANAFRIEYGKPLGAPILSESDDEDLYAVDSPPEPPAEDEDLYAVDSPPEPPAEETPQQSRHATTKAPLSKAPRSSLRTPRVEPEVVAEFARHKMIKVSAHTVTEEVESDSSEQDSTSSEDPTWRPDVLATFDRHKVLKATPNKLPDTLVKKGETFQIKKTYKTNVELVKKGHMKKKKPGGRVSDTRVEKKFYYWVKDPVTNRPIYKSGLLTGKKSLQYDKGRDITKEDYCKSLKQHFKIRDQKNEEKVVKTFFGIE